MQVARIKLAGRDMGELSGVSNEIRDIAKKFGVNYRGPIPLPTKILKVTTLRTPCGDGCGHGNATWDKFEMRIHKRLVEVQADDRVLRQIMRVNIPKDVKIEIKMIG